MASPQQALLRVLAIEWHKFVPGSSFFIPCVDRRGARAAILQEAKRIKVRVVCKNVVENGLYGLRVWRVDDTVC